MEVTAGTKLLDKAARIAPTAYEHQVDKAGEVYILHPLRFMTRAQSGDERMVTRGSLGVWISSYIVDVINCLIRRGEES